MVTLRLRCTNHCKAIIHYALSTTTSGYDGAIAGLANNLVAAVAGTPEIRYGLNGTGDFVVQYPGSGSKYICFNVLPSDCLGYDGKTVVSFYGPNNTGQASVNWF